MIMHASLIQYLQQFKILNTEEKAIIQESFQLVKYKAGETLSLAGKVTQKLFFIAEGILKITIPNNEIRDHAYFFMEENQFMSFLYSMYENIPAEQGLEASHDSIVMQIDKKGLFILFEKLPFFRALIDKIAHLTMVDMINTKNMYLSVKSSDRYAKLLLHQPALVKYVPLIDIASYLGITAQSLSRIRKSVH